MIDLIHKLTKLFPHLKKELRIAHIKERPEEFIKKTLNGTTLLTLMLIIFFFFMSSVFKFPILLLLPGSIILFFFLFLIILQSPKTKIRQRERELEREVLFAGRFLLIKIHSGKPLLNSLIDASKSYGVSSKYFKEIVDDVTMGTPIEKALENAIKYSPSAKFQKILFQISNSIKIGSDISDSLSSALDDIAKQQLIEIQRYGKKLSTLSLFYMLLAIILPSLGVAMFVVIGSLLGLFEGNVSAPIFVSVIIGLMIMQLIFISIFKSNRLMVNI